MGSYISLESLDIYNSIHIPTNDKLKLKDDKLNDDKLNDDKNSNNTRYCYGLKIA